MLATSFVLTLALYAAGVLRVWQKAGVGRGVRWRDVAGFVGAILALAVALSTPMDEWSEHWLAAHMVQHELLMVVAAPLLTLSAPIVAFLWALPATWRAPAAAAVHHPVPAAAWRLVTSPAVAFFLYGLALWAWHLPVMYEFALGHEAAHILQHLCFFGTATIFWWGVAHGRHGRLGYGAAVVYVFATTVHGGLLGALLTISPRVWYAPYLQPHEHGLTPLEDQQLAGLFMWVPASFAFVAAGLMLFSAWLRHSDRGTRYLPLPASIVPSSQPR
jgi:putative membrane protein